MKLWKKITLMFLAIIVFSAGTGFVYFNNIWGNVQKAFTQAVVATGKSTPAIQPTEPLTILLMGVDTRGGSDSWNGQSDSQIIMNLNPKTETTTMVSMERDTMTNILDQNGKIDSTQKMNAAYPTGYNAGGLDTAAEYAMNTIGEQAGININNFVVVNFDGLVNLVNDVGGVDVVNDSGGVDAFAETSKGQQVTLPTGQTVDSGAIYISNNEPSYTAYVPYYSDNREQLINGDQALVFARDRDTLNNGDYGRAAHQREVIQAVMKKVLELNNLSQYQKLLTDIGKDFKTNLQINDLSFLTQLLAYRNCFNKVVSIQYQGIGTIIPAGQTYATATGLTASYQLMPTDVDLAVQNAMRRSIDQPTITTLDSKMVTYESYYNTTTDAAGQSYYLPSATVTVKGKSPVTYGVNSDGGFVPITAANAGSYVSTTGGSVTAPSSSDSSSSSTAASQ